MATPLDHPLHSANRRGVVSMSSSAISPACRRRDHQCGEQDPARRRRSRRRDPSRRRSGTSRCREALGGCETGGAKITAAIACRRATSSMRSGRSGMAAAGNEDELLASCYRTSLALAAGHRLASIAFPAISTGIYGFPADRAARIAVATVMSGLEVPAPSATWPFAASAAMPLAITSTPSASTASLRTGRDASAEFAAA